MPARFVRAIGPSVVRARTDPGSDASEPRDLRVIDFACGFGAVGAMLRHDLTMAQLYAYYAETPWKYGDGRKQRQADAEWHAKARYAALAQTGHDPEARPAVLPAVHITGLDVAGNAMDYAIDMGLMEVASSENLVEQPTSAQPGLSPPVMATQFSSPHGVSALVGSPGSQAPSFPRGSPSLQTHAPSSTRSLRPIHATGNVFLQHSKFGHWSGLDIFPFG